MGSNRRNFIKKASAGAVGLAFTSSSLNAMSAKSYENIIGSNDRVHIAIQGLGRRLEGYVEAIERKESNVKLLYLCDVMQSQREKAAKKFEGKIRNKPKLENDVHIETSRHGDTRIYDVRGQLFFSSSERFSQAFDSQENVKQVVIDLTHSHIWDVTTVASLDSIIEKFQKNNIQVTVKGLNESSSIMIDKYGKHARI